MQNENRRMEEAHTCKICMDNEVEVVISCINCAYKLKDCAVGRKFIKRIVVLKFFFTSDFNLKQVIL